MLYLARLKSSVCALYAWPAWSVYTAAKAGVAKFSHGLYTELRPYNVHVTCRWR